MLVAGAACKTTEQESTERASIFKVSECTELSKQADFFPESGKLNGAMIKWAFQITKEV